MKNEAAEAGLVLEVRHVSGGYVEGGLFARQAGFHEVIHDVDFVVRHGEILGLVGESGTGKTTLTRMILGLLKPQSGEIIHYTKRPQIVFQDPYSSLNPAYTAEWAVEEPLRIYGKYDAHERKRRVHEMLERVELPRDCWGAKPDELSGGQRQRVFLAQTLAQDPEIILLDEPTNHLDIRHQIELIDYLHRWTATGRHSVIGVLHDINLALRLTDRVLLMREGRIVTQGVFHDIADAALLAEVYGTDIAQFMRQSFEKWRDLK